ncbi:3-dehydroquinate synthase [Salegentibacter salegens]|uniref:3-dehydroquinate synthase n=1 Tax=Salegentibacter salegens TaxID=143223 RepID=A0A1M7LNZ2_9FLAO|nr:3-dehydroquinate synthase [Salegentibacter salegens]PRX39546.1 3-dehydroquinate synthase [Salegentibacter salegens]SHM79916.1 3-dehydroquinate synthase [Salegentibacter salegens]
MSNMAAKGPVYYQEDGFLKINTYLKESKPSKVFILVDNNTHRECLPAFLQKIDTSENFEILEIEAGEINKNLETCTGVWNALSELDADRKSLIINVGGGVVTDLGGFVASIFKRGISYINVPTSLLAMVDASVGGKTGVDLGNLKNQIGVINHAEMVVIDPAFLATLPQAEMRSGLAEILKHALISSEAYWNKVTNLSELTLDDLDDIIKESVEIKSKVVTEDPQENGLRKTLNYGHTLGHAIESYFLTHPEKTTLLHGEAIAVGMILATYLSKELQEFPEEKLKEITSKILDIYERVEFIKEDIQQIIDLMKYDKKNSHGNINFVLLKDIGDSVIDCKVPNELIWNAFEYYKKT